MKRHLIIDGTAVYEIDEACMLRKRTDREEKEQGEKNNLYHQKYKEAHPERERGY